MDDGKKKYIILFFFSYNFILKLDELHFDGGNTYDYEVDIQERLKKANEEFEHDQTPAELKHRQRVSFDAVVKAVDIVQDPQEYGNGRALTDALISPVTEKSSSDAVNPRDDNDLQQYTVPLNDTTPKEGPTLLQQLKAMQFHGISPFGERLPSTNPHKTKQEGIKI